MLGRMIPLRPTVVEAKLLKLTEPPDMRPSQADEALVHELDFRFRLDNVKLSMMQANTNMTKETRLQKYQDLRRSAA